MPMATTTKSKPAPLGLDLAAERDRSYGIDPNAPPLSRIPTGSIRPDPTQPRKSFDEESLRELADSLLSVGQIQPITVRADPEMNDRYLLVAGERRWRASRIARREMMDCIVRGDERTAEIQLIENLQREDLKPLEEAFAFRDFMEERGLSQAALAKAVGKRPSTVSEILSLTTLPQAIIEALPEHPEIPKSQLVLIAKERDDTRRLRLWEEALGGTLTVQRGRAIAAGESGRPAPGRRGPRNVDASGAIARSLTANVRRLERMERLGKRETKEIGAVIETLQRVLAEKGSV